MYSVSYFRSSWEPLVSMIDTIDQFICLSDSRSYEIVLVSKYVKDLLGRDPAGKLCYRELQNLDHPCDFCINDVILKGSRRSYKWEYYNPVFNKYFLMVDTIIRWVDGGELKFGIGMDTTDQKKKERALEDRGRFFDSILTAIQEGISVLGPDLAIRYVNDFMNKWYAENVPLKGKKCYRAYRDRDKPCDPCPTVRCMKTGKTEREVVPGLPGKDQWIELFSYPMKGSDTGEVIGIVEFVRDITRLRKAEEEKEKLQIQLARAQKLEAIGRLAGGIAHDFNNMLTIIMGDAELVLNSLPSDSPARKYIKQIYETAMRSSDLVKQLLSFARKQVIKSEVVNLNRVIEPTIKLLSEIIGENIELVWIPGEDLYDIKVDPVQVDQILTNLCTNARDAISPGVGKIVIETKNVKLDESYCRIHAACIPGNYVMISVTDNGRGMDRETLKHIFEPFYTTKEVGKGTGLGLSTVYGIVKQNNGYIDAYSELGKGTTIKIYIPQYKSKEEISKEAMKVNQQIRERDLYGNETILMVEDDINILEMGKTILEKFGYKVLTAISPLEALEIVKEHGDSIELLITDLIMPGMNGRQLADSVAKLYPGIKVIYTSGYTPNVIMQSGVIRDNINFIQKPYSIHDLLLKVREVLNVKK